MNDALKLTGLKKKYGSRIALDGLDLNVQKGTVFGLVGPNGAGKTTTFSIIAGLIKQDSGTLDILGDGKFSPSKFKGRFALLAQDSLFPGYSKVRDILMFFARLQGMDKKLAKDEVNQILEQVDLADRANASVRSLSHGMIRRLAVAQAFLGKPELIILDEPTAGLDPKQVVRVRELITNRNKNQTVIISSHILSEIEGVCDHVAFIEKGKNVYQESIKKTLRKESVIHYTLGQNKLTELDFRTLVPKADFNCSEDNLKLTVSFSNTSFDVAKVNSLVLGFLLNKQIDIIELHTGTGLEDEYLKFSK